MLTICPNEEPGRINEADEIQVGGLRRQPMGRIRKLWRIFSPNPVSPEISSRRIYRLTAASELQDTWERRIIDRCDGRSVGSLIKALYSEELSRGGMIADIGMWKTLFDHQVVRTINKLAQQGYICVKTDDAVSAKDGSEDLG
jgi:hypothetical protein